MTESPLLRPVNPVAGVAQAGQDIAVIVEFAVDRGGKDGHVRMGFGKHLGALGGGQQADEFDVDGATVRWCSNSLRT